MIGKWLKKDVRNDVLFEEDLEYIQNACAAQVALTANSKFAWADCYLKVDAEMAALGTGTISMYINKVIGLSPLKQLMDAADLFETRAPKDVRLNNFHAVFAPLLENSAVEYLHLATFEAVTVPAPQGMMDFCASTEAKVQEKRKLIESEVSELINVTKEIKSKYPDLYSALFKRVDPIYR